MSDETRANATVFDYLRWRGDLTLPRTASTRWTA